MRSTSEEQVGELTNTKSLVVEREPVGKCHLQCYLDLEQEKYDVGDRISK